MRTTYVLAQHHIAAFRNQLLKDSDHLLGTSIRNFDFTFNEKNLNTQETEIQCFNTLALETFPILGDVLMFPKTIQTLLRLSIELKLYDIHLDNLPQETALQREIHKAMVLIAPHIHELTINENTHFKVSLDGLSHAQAAFIERHQFDTIPSHDIQPKDVSFRVALNLRSEIEACIQDILNNDVNNVVIAVANLSSHQAFIETILNRYNLDFQFQDRSLDLLKVQFLSIVTLGIDSTSHNVLSLLEANPLGLKYPRDLIYYIQHFEIAVADLMIPFTYAQEDEQFQNLFDLQNRIQDDVVILQTFLNTLSNHTYQELLILAYETLRSTTQQPLHKIKAFLEANMSLYSESTHSFFVDHFSKLTSTVENTSGLRIVDINQLPHEPIDTLYVLNLTAKNYPSVSKRTGIIDESYLSAIDGYPGLDVRTEYDLKAQEAILHSSRRLVLSYANATFEGKSFEPSYPIVTFCENMNVTQEAWKLSEQTFYQHPKHFLSKDIAQKIYETDGLIKGSISSFQMYLNDPYAFFIERGLNCREPEYLHFDPRIIGTLNHSIVEHLNDDHNPWIQLYNAFPQHSQRIQMIKRRNDVMMQLNREHIKESVADTDFEIMKRESWFDENNLYKGIHIRGIIDRIDHNDEALLIVDYKSSPQTLTQASVLDGHQLQLLTYAVIAQKLYNKPVLGVFYYGFRSAAINIEYATYNASKGILINDNDPIVLWNGENKYSGWFFDRPELHFDTANYFGGLRETKSGMSLWRKEYDIEKVTKVLAHNYEAIRNFILDGVLEPDDIEITHETEIDLRKGDPDDNI